RVFTLRRSAPRSMTISLRMKVPRELRNVPSPELRTGLSQPGSEAVVPGWRVARSEERSFEPFELVVRHDDVAQEAARCADQAQPEATGTGTNDAASADRIADELDELPEREDLRPGGVDDRAVPCIDAEACNVAERHGL